MSASRSNKGREARAFRVPAIAAATAAAAAALIEPSPVAVGLGTLLILAVYLAQGLTAGLIATTAILGSAALIPIASSHVYGNGFTLPLSSGAWVVASLLPAAVVTAHARGGWPALILVPLPVFVLLDLAAFGGWLNVRTLTDPAFRMAVPGIAAMAACLLTRNTQTSFYVGSRWTPVYVLAAIFSGAIAAQLPSGAPIRGVTFDESHGRWETVQASFGPDDFGRGGSYTYSVIAAYARALTGDTQVFLHEADQLPTTDRAFVLKMPTAPLGDSFRARLTQWVESGGRLLVVADHTDLYDHAQHLNRLLSERWAVKIDTDAAYDRDGKPNISHSLSLFRILGRIDATGMPTPWMTGSSAVNVPLGSVVLASYGPSFTEPGNYSGPNRFGPFLPRLSLPYVPQAAVFAFPAGAGIVAVILDSTPWSNFSSFREEYRRLFRGVLGALGEPSVILLLGILSPALLAIAFAAALLRSVSTLVTLAFLFGLVGGLGWRASAAGVAPMVEGRDFGLRVIVGSEARLEFLPQLLAPGERNYARIVSALTKYGLNPIATAHTGATLSLASARRWVFLEPDPEHLPSEAAVFDHLRRGGDLTVLFMPHVASDKRVRDWLISLDLGLGNSIALATAEDAGRMASDAFAARRGAALLRDARVITFAREDGLLKEHAFDRLWQTYTVRPTNLPRTSGLLTIGFSADQVTDAAVGDVWEGVRPSALGRLRERQFGSLLLGADGPGPWPENILPSAPPQPTTRTLRSFLVAGAGKILLEGTLSDAEMTKFQRSPIAFNTTPRLYLADLRARALAIVDEYCPVAGEGVTVCAARLLGADGMEWLVTRKEKAGALAGIELVHERQWSGTGANINIVFAD